MCIVLSQLSQLNKLIICLICMQQLIFPNYHNLNRLEGMNVQFIVILNTMCYVQQSISISYRFPWQGVNVLHHHVPVHVIAQPRNFIWYSLVNLDIFYEYIGVNYFYTTPFKSDLSPYSYSETTVFDYGCRCIVRIHQGCDSII